MTKNVENTSSIIQSLTRQSKISRTIISNTADTFVLKATFAHRNQCSYSVLKDSVWVNKYLSMLNRHEIHNYVFITRSLNVPYMFTYCCVYSSYSVQTCSLVQSRIKYLRTVFNLWINEHFGFQSAVNVLILRFCYRPNTLRT